MIAPGDAGRRSKAEADQALDGASIIVTGGGSGIGRAAAQLLAESGALVTVADRDKAGCEETAALIRDGGGTAQAISADVSIEEDAAAITRAALSAYGRLNGACNAAGVAPVRKLLHELSLAEWDRIISINLSAAFLCMKYQLPPMLEAGKGSIVLIGSTASVIGFPLSVEYAAAKSGLLGLVRCASCDYAKLGVRVNAVLPGATRTAMFSAAILDQGFEDYVAATHPIGRFAEPRELGYAIRWLLSDEASFVTGSVMAVDGGSTSI